MRAKRTAIMLRVTAAVLIAFGPAGSVSGKAAQPASDLAKIMVNTAPKSSVQALADSADVIVYGRFDSADRELPTGRTVKSGKLVNFVQTMHAIRYFKGGSRQLIRVLSTGIEPLPDADDPLNREYPGPMIEGEYVCFLKQVSGRSDVYTIIGGWQGVYPVHDGKTIALEDAGFKELDGLTLDEFGRRIAWRRAS